MTAELKPCPFCGGEASAHGYVRYGKPLTDVFWKGGLPITEAFFCNCIACGVTNIAGQVGHQTREQSITAWNTRADLSQAAIAAAMMGAAIAAGNKIVELAKEANPDQSPLKLQILRVAMEKAVKASIPTDATARKGKLI